MATFHLQIVTPDRLCYDGPAERILVRTVNGDTCILANHSDYAAALGIGEAHMVTEDGTTRAAACTGGMISVRDNEVRVMATTWEWAEEIDLARAERARDAAEKRIEEAKAADQSYTIAEMKMKRALIRIQTGSRQ